MGNLKEDPTRERETFLKIVCKKLRVSHNNRDIFYNFDRNTYAVLTEVKTREKKREKAFESLLFVVHRKRN